MTLRKPAAHLRRAPAWRRSGDESYWESLVAEGDVLPPVSRPPRPPRPQSAIEGGQLDGWLEHLQRMQSDFLGEPTFIDRTTSFHRDTGAPAWRQSGFPSFSRGSSSCGSPSLCESSLGSQESLQTGVFSPPELRESWERAHIMQAPRKEQPQLSYLAPVKIGWLPIQRRVMVADACKQKQSLDTSAYQVKLKQPITPVFQKNPAAASKQQDAEVERSSSSFSAAGVRTWQTPGQDSAFTKQVPGKQGSPANEEDRSVGWQTLRRGWNTNRVSAFPGGSQSDEVSTGSVSEPLKRTLCRTASADPCTPYRTYAPLHRTNSVQPVRASAPLHTTSSSSQPSHTQTSSAVTTLVPQNKAGFSSITISSKKVCRSASLPSSDSQNYSSQSSGSPSPPPAPYSMDQRLRVQKKAMIVKVTEQRTMSSQVPSTKAVGTPPAGQAVDTVVHRRKATIIKVTEHRESYSPAKAGSGARRPEYRHSYTEGLWSLGNHSQHGDSPSHHQPDPSQRLNSTIAPNKTTSDAEKSGETLHRSTLNLFVSTSTPTSSEVPLRADGQRTDRPMSCYGSVFGHAEPSWESVTRPVARKWSFGLTPETHSNLVNSHVSPERGVAQPVADTLGPDRGQKERPPPESTARRASPSLTLIKAPDPNSSQSAEEVLALNAAAIIANIKLQRQLSKKKTPNSSSGKDSTTAPQGKTDAEKRMKLCPDQSPARCRKQPHAAFVPLSSDHERPPGAFSLQEALQRSRPDFISRSQGRVQKLERRMQERRTLGQSRHRQPDAVLKQTMRAYSGPHNDNLFKTRDRTITGKETQLRSKRVPSEVKGKKEAEEKKREEFLSNRQRAELFNKRLLDQTLQRNNS